MLLWVNKFTALGTVKNLLLVIMVLIPLEKGSIPPEKAEEVFADFQRSPEKGVRECSQQHHMTPYYHCKDTKSLHQRPILL